MTFGSKQTEQLESVYDASDTQDNIHSSGHCSSAKTDYNHGSGQLWNGHDIMDLHSVRIYGEVISLSCNCVFLFHVQSGLFSHCNEKDRQQRSETCAVETSEKLCCKTGGNCCLDTCNTMGV